MKVYYMQMIICFCASMIPMLLMITVGMFLPLHRKMQVLLGFYPNTIITAHIVKDKDTFRRKQRVVLFGKAVPISDQKRLVTKFYNCCAYSIGMVFLIFAYTAVFNTEVGCSPQNEDWECYELPKFVVK